LNNEAIIKPNADKPEPKIYLPQSPKDPPASPKAKPMAGRHKENILS
jgi:hypothetical protein